MATFSDPIRIELCEIEIDPDIAQKIPPLDVEERRHLEQNIIDEGCRDPLITWKQGGSFVLIDGHNRLSICQENDIPFRIVYGDFADKADVFIWMIRNQLGRRNLPAAQRVALALELKQQIAERAKANQKAAGGDKKSEDAKSHLSTLTEAIEPVDTREELAFLSGVAEGTVHKAKKVLEDASEDLKQQMLSGEKSINAAYEEHMSTDEKEIKKRKQREAEKRRREKEKKALEAEKEALLKENAEALKKAKEVTRKKKAIGEDLRKLQQEDIVDGEDVDIPAGIEVICGDCIETLPMLDGGFDLLVTDPPYNVKDVEWDKIGTREEYLKFTEDWLSLALPLMADRYHAFIFCSPLYFADIEMLFRDMEIQILSRVIWHHKNLSMGRAPNSKLISSWEPAFHIGSGDLYLPDSWGDERFDVKTFAAPQTNFSDKKIHQTQKPLDLIKWMVEIGSPSGGRVLDPFAGGGTTADACKQLGRTCVTIEKSEEFVSILKGRLAA